MAVKYGWQFVNMLLQQGIFGNGIGGTSSTRRVYLTVFPGVQPSAADIIANWSTYSSTYLAHFINTTSPAWNVNNVDSEGTAFLTTIVTTTATAYRSGTATWGIIWTVLQPSEAIIQGTSLPGSSFIVAPVGDFTSSDVIRLQDTTLVAGNTATLNGVVINIALSPGD